MKEESSLEQINKIIKEKWQDLELEDSKERLKDLVINLHSIEDFEKEYLFTIEKIEEKEESGEITQEQIDEHMKGFFEKWSFIFLSVLNLDISNPFLFFYMFESLLEIEEEYYLEDED